ncbi:Atu2307/SP_0267 family LLM class monooxygenase [Gordonia sp. (in: high G+C Gram-positive bacteria)]|uniref:Atu2307/SP_0267 family LLM class monooxygenase n=1 Tax=Gordonia sp. (in: high G+C Gram-positive bacteria) TaxID=84139 RepID=UPI0016A65F3B|nr:Atu2307/SP_0267 family LLM class monooxygenase [Gordonia sp. (in: high G+C Gram-positive bacteria)]NLG46312.1 LLM class flavin-dependent oxidoreductase [Gordonia sp. (in: high G+C Gram-positive bacteria)]
MSEIEFGLDTFGGLTRDANGDHLPHAQVIRDIVEDAVVADQAGLDFFGVGEHHRPDYAVSSPEMVLAAIAGQTERIRLGSAVTVLSSDDPVRVFERFATLDAVSGGRAEIVAGRGSFTESFPLFGYDLRDYEVLFEEKLALLAELVKEEPVTWQGSTRAGLQDQRVFPTTEDGLRAWVGVGGSPESVVRTARYGFGLFLAIIGGPAERFSAYIDLFERAQDEFQVPRQPVAVHSPGLVADTDEQARDLVRDGWFALRKQMGRERGWPAPNAGDFEREIETGALYVGSPETVAAKIAATVQALDVDRFDLKYDQPVQHGDHLRSIELYGSKVVPLVKDMLA